MNGTMSRLQVGMCAIWRVLVSKATSYRSMVGGEIVFATTLKSHMKSGFLHGQPRYGCDSVSVAIFAREDAHFVPLGVTQRPAREFSAGVSFVR